MKFPVMCYEFMDLHLVQRAAWTLVIEKFEIMYRTVFNQTFDEKTFYACGPSVKRCR